MGKSQQPNSLGIAGSLAGLLALIAAVLPLLLLPAPSPPRPHQPAAAEAVHILKDRIVAKIKGATREEEKAPPAENWSQYVSVAAIPLALLATCLAVFSLFRGGKKRYAALALSLGAAALAFQLPVLLIGAVLAVTVLYAVKENFDAATPWLIGIAAIIVLAMTAALVLGATLSQAAAIVLGAVLVALAVYSLFNTF
jgi:hypothetical protein